MNHRSSWLRQAVAVIPPEANRKLACPCRLFMIAVPLKPQRLVEPRLCLLLGLISIDLTDEPHCHNLVRMNGELEGMGVNPM